MKFLLFAAAVLADVCPEKFRVQAKHRNDTIFTRNGFSQSRSGSCHYQIHSDIGHGALSVDFKGTYSGFYAENGQTWVISGNRQKQFTQFSPYEYAKTCEKEYSVPENLEEMPDFSSNDLEKPSKRLRRETEDKYIELIIVVSKGLVEKYKSKNTTDKTSRLRPVYHRYESVHNIIDNFYKIVGIRVALLDIFLWDTTDHVNMEGKNSGEILDDFNTWRKNQARNMTLNKDQRNRWKAHDNAQFVVPHDTFESPTIGKGWTDAFCERFSAGVNEDHHSSEMGLATTMAHELGHNVGLNHDTSSCECEAGSACIMEASSSPSRFASKWSSCSIDRLNNRKDHWPCLDDIPDPKLLHGSGICGNGIVEREEDCDCGDVPTEQCEKCCDAKTCKFHSGSDCSDESGPCCRNCKLQKGGTVCRAKKDKYCDLPEYCNGYEAKCPSNVFVRNGEPCESEGRCMLGSCMKKDDHCKYLFGDSASFAEDCAKKGNNGRVPTAKGNCGEYYRSNQDYSFFSRCNAGDEVCGKVFCQGDFQRSVITEFETYLLGKTGDDRQCSYFDWTNYHTKESGDQFYNQDRMPFGTPCGEDSVCAQARDSNYRSECRHLGTLWTSGEWGECKNNCSGHGICNSNGNCHCDDKYGGPACDEKGYGGSSDSNRANYKVRDEGMVLFATIFSVLFAFAFISAMVAKFHFGHNLTAICYYQPCAGRKASTTRARANSSEPMKPSSRPPPDVMNPDWGDNENQAGPEQIYVDVVDRKFLAKKAALKGPPPRPPVAKTPISNAQTTNPFQANWSDSEISPTENFQRPVRSAPAPPGPPVPPPRDY